LIVARSQARAAGERRCLTGSELAIGGVGA
jgi:hypothetical protein